MKKGFRKIIIALIVSLVFSTCTMTSLANNQATNENLELSGDYAEAIVRMAMSIVKSNYKYEISDEEIYKNTLATILQEHP